MVLRITDIARGVALALWAGMACAGDLPAPDADFPVADMGQIELGRLLFYDPIIRAMRRATACRWGWATGATGWVRCGR